MNARQAWYQIGRVTNGCGDLLYSASAPLFAYWAAQAWGINTKAVVVNSIFAAVIGLKGYSGLWDRIRLIGIKKHLESHEGEYEFAESKRIIICHKEGLEMLLEETSKKRCREWGTVLNGHEEGEDAVIDKISTEEEAKERKIIRWAGPGIMAWNLRRAMELNFDGMQHYHPRAGSKNYTINTLDRRMPEDWINLLTFNTLQGPEVIGYNIRHTYIPAKKEDKSILVKATPRQIMEYLR